MFFQAGCQTIRGYCTDQSCTKTLSSFAPASGRTSTKNLSNAQPPLLHEMLGFLVNRTDVAFRGRLTRWLMVSVTSVRLSIELSLYDDVSSPVLVWKETIRPCHLCTPIYYELGLHHHDPLHAYHRRSLHPHLCLMFHGLCREGLEHTAAHGTKFVLDVEPHIPAQNQAAYTYVSTLRLVGRLRALNTQRLRQPISFLSTSLPGSSEDVRSECIHCVTSSNSYMR